MPGMSSNLNYKQVANVERRTWDVEAYAKRADERAKNEAEGGTTTKKKKKSQVLNTLGGPQVDDDELREEFQPAVKGAAGPEKSERAYLKARTKKVDVDSKIGSVEMINPEAVATTKSAVGEPGSIKVQSFLVVRLYIVLQETCLTRCSEHDRMASQNQGSGGIAKCVIVF